MSTNTEEWNAFCCCFNFNIFGNACHYITCDICSRDQRDSRFSRILENFFSFSLSVLDLEPFQFHFHFSKKSEGILFFTFHFSTKAKAIRISPFFLEKKEWNQVPGITSPLSLFPIVFPKIVKPHVSISLKILAKFQF